MERIKSVTKSIASVLFVVLGLALIILFIARGPAFFEAAYPWLVAASAVTILIALLVMLPLVAFRRTRTWGVWGLLLSSYIFGATLWAYGFLYAFVYWGWLGVIVGLVFFGVGVVPVGAVAALLHGNWGALGTLAFLAIVTFGTRIFALHIAEKIDNESEAEFAIPDQDEIVMATELLSHRDSLPPSKAHSAPENNHSELKRHSSPETAVVVDSSQAARDFINAYDSEGDLLKTSASKLAVHGNSYRVMHLTSQSTGDEYVIYFDVSSMGGTSSRGA